MHALHEHLQCPLTRQRDARDRERLAAAFPVLRTCAASHYLALRRYLNDRPEKFFSLGAYEIYLDWLQTRDSSHRETLKAYFADHQGEFNRALLFLREINLESWHDRVLRTGDDYDLVRSIDRHVHPTYLRLVEAVFTPFLRLISYFSRIDRSKGTDGLDVWSVIQELVGSPAATLIRPYEHLIRNGIAHGGITFLQREIRYRDKKGNENTFSVDSVVRILDDLLDTCNGMAASLKVFFAVFRDRGYIPPREILVEELQEETSTPWWRIEACVEARIAGRSQLTVFARPDTRHYAKIQWSTFQSGILAEYFAPRFDRYFFSLRSRKTWLGWAAFDGKKLRDLRKAGAEDFSLYTGVLEDDLIFYSRNLRLPSFLWKINTLLMSFRLNMPLTLEDIRSNLEIPNVKCRSATAHRNSWGAVIRGNVVVEGLGPNKVVETIRNHRRRIIRAAVSQARRERGWSAAAYLPIAFAQVGVFRRDFRCRRLSDFGLGEDLICTVRLHRQSRIRNPDIAGSSVESDGKWRIAWNRAWLGASGESLE